MSTSLAIDLGGTRSARRRWRMDDPIGSPTPLGRWTAPAASREFRDRVDGRCSPSTARPSSASAFRAWRAARRAAGCRTCRILDGVDLARAVPGVRVGARQRRPARAARRGRRRARRRDVRTRSCWRSEPASARPCWPAAASSRRRWRRAARSAGPAPIRRRSGRRRAAAGWSGTPPAGARSLAAGDRAGDGAGAGRRGPRRRRRPQSPRSTADAGARHGAGRRGGAARSPQAIISPAASPTRSTCSRRSCLPRSPPAAAASARDRLRAGTIRPARRHSSGAALAGARDPAWLEDGS